MSAEYLPADLDALYVLAGLVDAYWSTGGGDAKLAAEIRQQTARFGLSPLDRRRLEWTLDAPEAEAEAPRESAPDPRAGMRLVSG